MSNSLCPIDVIALLNHFPYLPTDSCSRFKFSSFSYNCPSNHPHSFNLFLYPWWVLAQTWCVYNTSPSISCLFLFSSPSLSVFQILSPEQCWVCVWLSFLINSLALSGVAQDLPDILLTRNTPQRGTAGKTMLGKNLNQARSLNIHEGKLHTWCYCKLQ